MGFRNAHQLKKLSLSGIDLNWDSAFTQLKEYLVHDNLNLTEFDISWTHLKGAKLSELIDIIIVHKPNLKDINLSYNCIENMSTVQGVTFIEKLKELLTECKYLNHLNIGGMNLGASIQTVLPYIRDAPRLCSVHLSNNSIPADLKALLFNQLQLSYK